MSGEVRAFANPNQVDPAKIADALAELWREADSEAGEGGVGTTRACGLTLIAIVAGDAELAECAARVAAATAVVPARTLFVDIDADADGGLTAEVSALCSLDRNAGKTVCQEQVLVKVAPARFVDVPPLVAPLLIADLPVVLLLPDPRLLDSAPVKGLLPVIDTLITDSGPAADARGLLLRLHEQIVAGWYAVRDLAFERLGPWRTCAAEAYDCIAGANARLRAVVVEAANGDSHGALLNGWIETRLADWNAAAATGVATELRIEPRARDGLGPFALVLESVAPGPRLAFRRYGRRIERVTEPAPVESSRPPLPLGDEAEALTHVLCDPRPDRAHVAALEAALARRWPE